MKLTYRQLADVIDLMSEEQQGQDVTIWDQESDEHWPAQLSLAGEQQSMLDEGHPVLSMVDNECGAADSVLEICDSIGLQISENRYLDSCDNNQYSPFGEELVRLCHQGRCLVKLRNGQIRKLSSTLDFKGVEGVEDRCRGFMSGNWSFAWYASGRSLTSEELDIVEIVRPEGSYS